MNIFNMKIVVVSLVLLTVACKPQIGSNLAVSSDPLEGQFTKKICADSSTATARMSKMTMGAVEMVLFNPQYCSSLKKFERGSQNKSFGLEGEQATAATRKPVMVVYGYMGSGESNKVEHQGVSDMMPWVNQNFRPVMIPPGASPSEAQSIVANDRRQNQGDYGKDSWVGAIVASHAYKDPKTGQHKMVKTNIIDQKIVPNQVGPIRESTSVRTTDVQKALLEGIGHDAGTVYCMTWGCQSGAAKDDPQFKGMQQSAINPDQKRIFHFSSSADKLAGFSNTQTPDGIRTTSPAERSLVFASQAVDPAKGLTVNELQEKLKEANLGASGGFDLSTVYTPYNGGATSDSGNPFGTKSHDNATLYYSPQGPSVVGPKDAYVFPPGVKANTFIPPVATGQQTMQDVVNHLPPNTYQTGNVQNAPPEYSPNSPDYRRSQQEQAPPP